MAVTSEILILILQYVLPILTKEEQVKIALHTHDSGFQGDMYS